MRMPLPREETMGVAERLLLRLERQEMAFAEAKKTLNEAQRGFLRGLGWKPLSKSEEYWSDPDGHGWSLQQAVTRAKEDIRGGVRGPNPVATGG
jgi:hypothetical protein